MPTKTAEPMTLRGVPDTEEVYEIIGDNFLTRDQVVRGFGVSSHTVQSWVKWKGLPYIRIVGARRDSIAYRESKVRAWADKLGLHFDPPPKS